ncbi:class I SAM-dependent DNA methyltransferase [Anaerotruncus rubiinfantis]|uniref:class I SAM-dependent DNA methyltransferase n=1 Tax=Anaerotruncus rubiinfantis TaxID=1720200 RepID=UPI0018980139|nr:class I SAM-dependent methyltransferase [Anaerotruncus rubiinfantis]
MPANFETIADYYDIMYVDPAEYRAEAQKAAALIEKYKTCPNRRLLDLACGTGEQSRTFAESFAVTGIDLSEEMLHAAARKVPSAEFLPADIFDFHFDEPFGAAVNLYGSIGFARGYDQLRDGLRCVYDCLTPGGVFLLTPWATRETFREGIVSQSGERDGIHFCRMETVKRKAPQAVEVEMFHLVEQDGAVRQFHHLQKITLFSEAEYRAALAQAGFILRERLSEAEFRMGAFVCTKA